MKTTAPTIESLKFDYVNSNIGKLPRAVVRSTDFKVFQFDAIKKSEEVISEIEKESYLAASLDELLCYAKDGWNDRDWVVALGSVAEVGGSRDVPFLDRRGSERYLSLYRFGVGWSPVSRFLAVRKVSDAREIGTGDLDALILRIEALEAWRERCQQP